MEGECGAPPLRSIDPGMDGGIVARIDAKLARLRETNGVQIPLAIESGSRAWGFPSPDSDYDCRFIFVRPLDDYLALYPKRDVIEMPVDAVFDVGGWDLKKALILLLKGNAVVAEWLTSPIIYSADAAFRDEFHALADHVLDRARVARHYLHLGERIRRSDLSDPADAPLKKLFYVLRPAVMLRWLRLHPTRAYGPMHFPTLVREAELPLTLTALVDDLLARKSETRELGRGVLPAPIGGFMDAEFDEARRWVSTGEGGPSEEERRAAEAFFRRMVRTFGGSPA